MDTRSLNAHALHDGSSPFTLEATTPNGSPRKCPAIVFRTMGSDDVDRLADIDRSEEIERICRIENGREIWTEAGHECLGWDKKQLDELRLRFLSELERGGAAVGAYYGERLAGFALLGHRPPGFQADMLTLELMYVGRPYRRRGIATRLMQLLSRTASARGAKSLYISSTETSSAVGFYRSMGSEYTSDPDPDMLAKEPLDIHMIRPLPDV